MLDLLLVTFPVEIKPIARSEYVAFWAEVGHGKLVECRISREALQDHFEAGGGSTTELATSYTANRKPIQEKALEWLVRSDGKPILLKTSMF